ncbi:MAG: ATPase [Bacteroidetes bacterium]|nr:MAG: ATPase [Bacteroidota bacterium]
MKNQDLKELTKDQHSRSLDFTFTFESSKSPNEIFETLLDARGWWSGLYSEKFKGSTDKLNEDFTFNAGGGAHYTKQRLTELVPDKKIVWLVVESNLNFLKDPEEWTGTKICFDISKKENKTEVRFTHEGLVPNLEAYDGCANAWTKYLQKLSGNLG